jgi:hypothetical protein
MNVHLVNGGDFAVVFLVSGLLLALILSALFLLPKSKEETKIEQFQHITRNELTKNMRLE